MKEKIKIAQQLKLSRKKFSNNPEFQKLCIKCYNAYIIECIIKRKDNFQIKFNMKYIDSFSKRMSDWYEYILDNIYRFFLIHFTPNNDNTTRKYTLIHSGVLEPIHVKIPQIPDEYFLHKFLETNGFKVITEHTSSTGIIFDVVKF